MLKRRDRKQNDYSGRQADRATEQSRLADLASLLLFVLGFHLLGIWADEPDSLRGLLEVVANHWFLAT
jgi:hypothetical protein